MTPVLRGFAMPWTAIVFAAVLALLFALATECIPGRRVANLEIATTLRRA